MKLWHNSLKRAPLVRKFFLRGAIATKGASKWNLAPEGVAFFQSPHNHLLRESVEKPGGQRILPEAKARHKRTRIIAYGCIYHSKSVLSDIFGF